MKKSFEPLCRQLGYTFNNKKLLEMALSHRSVGACNNERLEFIGDSIVNFVIAEALYTQLPSAREGELSRLRSHLVRGDTLAELAQEFKVGDYLHLGIGELKSGGHTRPSILADTMEAIIAAIYFDAGMTVCQQRILEWYRDRLSIIDLETKTKDAKTLLQEYLQSKKFGLPIYKVSAIEGKDHAQEFHIECIVEALDRVSKGAGSNRRKAEQEAAEAMLRILSQ